MHSFRIENIKAFKDSGEIELKPITILVGKNSCGKSTLLRFPAVFSQSANTSDRFLPITLNGDYLDYGNFEDVVSGKEESAFSFSISYIIDISASSRVFSSQNGTSRSSRTPRRPVREKVTVRPTIRRVGRSIIVSKFEVFIGEQKLSELSWDKEKKTYVLGLFLMYEGGHLKPENEWIPLSADVVTFDKFFPVYSYDIISDIGNAHNIRIDNEKGIHILRDYLAKSDYSKSSASLTEEELIVGGVYSIFDYYTRILRTFSECFTSEAKNGIAYIGPFRKNPDRIYRYSETSSNHVGPHGENIGDMLYESYLNKNDGIYDEISEWLYKYYGYHLDIHDFSNNFFQIRVLDGYISSNIIDVGFGISQVLPIVSEVLKIREVARQPRFRRYKRYNNILLVEQPELHLHPAAQASLAELFALCVTGNKNARLIIETHSEHLISKLQVLIADEACPLTNDMVQILYIDKDAENGAFIEEMTIKENGKFLKEWPTGFFDQGYNLAYELMKKSAARGKRNAQNE